MQSLIQQTAFNELNQKINLHQPNNLSKQNNNFSFIYFASSKQEKLQIKLQVMKTTDLNFIEIKTKRSPISTALNSITVQKLKPFYNTVYQLLNLKHPNNKPYSEVVLELQQKINKNMPKIVMERIINQETLQFKVVKPLQKRGFSDETLSSRGKKCKSVTKSFFLTNQEYSQHKQKDDMGQKFDKLRNLSKTLSESTLKNKKKYNILDKYHKIIDHHYGNLQLQPQYIVGDEHEQSSITKHKQNRYKLEASKWIENILVSDDQQHTSLMRKQKAKYLRQRGNILSQYKGITKKQVSQCKEIIEQDKELMGLSMSQNVSTTKISEVKSLYELNRLKLSNLINQYKTSKNVTPNLSIQREAKSCRITHTNKSLSHSPDYKQYQKYKKSENENPQTYRIGDRYSNFRSKDEKKGVLFKLKQRQKTKYKTKVMDVNRHRKLFLKQK